MKAVTDKYLRKFEGIEKMNFEEFTPKINLTKFFNVKE